MIFSKIRRISLYTQNYTIIKQGKKREGKINSKRRAKGKVPLCANYEGMRSRHSEHIGTSIASSRLTYHFSRPEFGGEPGVIAELSPAYSTSREVLREAADSGDERCLAAFTAARNSRVQLLLGAARGAITRDAVPERTRQQPSGPVNGLHRAY